MRSSSLGVPSGKFYGFICFAIDNHEGVGTILAILKFEARIVLKGNSSRASLASQLYRSSLLFEQLTRALKKLV